VGQLVLGVEADFQGWTVGEIRYTAVTGDFLTAHSKWGGSVRGRLGFAADRALLYVAGGAAFVSTETAIPFTGISIGGDDTRVGWTVGAGVDYAFEQLVYRDRISLLAVRGQVLCLSDTNPEPSASSGSSKS
jgi:outer membrane immunogenic protein